MLPELTDEQRAWYILKGYQIQKAGRDRYWLLNGKFHRDDAPAVERTDGTRFWCLNGKIHREDGPAYQGYDGSVSWYLNGIYMTQEEHQIAIQKLREERNAT